MSILHTPLPIAVCYACQDATPPDESREAATYLNLATGEVISHFPLCDACCLALGVAPYAPPASEAPPA